MFGKLIEIFNGEDDKITIYRLLRRVQFDIDLQQDEIPYQKYIAMSTNIQDAKGNSKCIGTLKLTNLRIMWHLKNEITTNLSFGLDSITFVDLKTTPTQIGSGIKFVLTIKAQNLTNTRYQFKFVGHHAEQLNTFHKIIDIYKKITNTKYFRSICLSIKYDNQYQLMLGQQLKNTYNQCTLIQDEKKSSCKLIITNVRLVIIKQGEKKMNYGISWILIKNIEFNSSYQNIKGLRIFCQGQFTNKIIIISCKKIIDTKKLQQQLKSFIQTYHKSPIFGFGFQQDKNMTAKSTDQYDTDVIELQSSKVKLMQRKKAYTSMDGLSSISNTQYNDELGLMIEKFPQGISRRDLWEILK